MLFDKHRSEKTLKEILVEAVALNKNVGSSTAVLASLQEPNIMKTTNLGDSGYIIYQASNVENEIVLKKIFRSEE